MTNSAYIPLEDRPIQPGEYDLANISLIGFDPLTGRSFDACQQEFREALARVTTGLESVRWWQFRRQARLRIQAFNLMQRHGTHGLSI